MDLEVISIYLIVDVESQGTHEVTQGESEYEDAVPGLVTEMLEYFQVGGEREPASKTKKKHPPRKKEKKN